MKLNRYMKMNIGTYRATYPDDLAEAARRGKCIIHPINRATMALQAQIAEVVVLATGRVPQCLEEEARAVFAMLKALVPEKLACLGMTATGWPKHPSRLGYSNKLRSFT